MLGNQIPDKAPSAEQSLTDKKKLTCKICSKQYAVKDSLKVHMLTIHEKNLAFKCIYPNCSKNYFNKYKLECHLRTHIQTGDRPFQCSQCSRRFTTKGTMTTHFKKHSNPQKYQCDICLKKYISKGNLINHRNIVHFNQKKFKCNICNQSFGRSSSLKTHRVLHTGEKPFVCLVNNCGKRYAEKGNLLFHRKTKHPTYISDVQNNKANHCEALIEPESNLIGTSETSNDPLVSIEGNDKFSNESMSHLGVQCNSLEEHKKEEDVIANILDLEDENLIEYYLLNHEEEYYSESRTYESSAKIVFPLNEK